MPKATAHGIVRIRTVDRRSRLASWRAQIDGIDARLVSLLNARFACALEIGRLKQAIGVPLLQSKREQEVLGHVRQAALVASGPLSAESASRIFERIIQETRRAEHRGGLAGHRADEAAAPGCRRRG